MFLEKKIQMLKKIEAIGDSPNKHTIFLPLVFLWKSSGKPVVSMDQKVSIFFPYGKVVVSAW